MNLRGLAFDDPNGTDMLKLPTIEFESSDGSSTATDEDHSTNV